jgi:hypothetical protein
MQVRMPIMQVRMVKAAARPFFDVPDQRGVGSGVAGGEDDSGAVIEFD